MDGDRTTAVEPGTRWLTDDEARHWLALVALLEVLPAALDTQLKRDAGMNSYEYMILSALSDAPAWTMGMSQVAGCVSGSLSRLSHAVGRLEAKGWVTRTPTGRGKAVDLTMTDLGAATMEQVAPGHVAEARRLVVEIGRASCRERVSVVV